MAQGDQMNDEEVFLAAVIAQFLLCFVLLFLQRGGAGASWVGYQLDLGAVWLSFMTGACLSYARFYEEMVAAVSLGFWGGSAVVGGILALIIGGCRRPRSTHP